MQIDKLIINNVTDLVDRNILQEEIDKFLEKFPPRNRLLFQQRINGLTFKEIARNLSLSDGRVAAIFTVMSRKFRNTKRLRLIIFDLFPDVEKAYKKQRKIEKERSKEEKRLSDLQWTKFNEEQQKLLDDHAEYLRRVEQRRTQEYVAPRVEIIQFNVRGNPIQRPYFVTLKYLGITPILVCDPEFGTINRNRDPEVYDRWLKELIEENKTT